MKSQRKNYSGKNKKTKRNLRRNVRSKTRKMRGGTPLSSELIKTMTSKMLTNLINFSDERIKELDLSNRKKNELEEIALVLNNNNIINKLTISNNKSMDDKLANLFANELIDTDTDNTNGKKLANHTIVDLDISNNKITNLDIFAEVLKTNKTLISLNLSHNEITDLGVENFVEALKNNKTLKHLDLSYNKMTDNSMEKFVDALNYNKNLANFILKGNYCNIGGKLGGCWRKLFGKNNRFDMNTM